MDVFIPNGTPWSYHLGTKDLSSRTAVNAPVMRSQHLAFIPFIAARGPVDEVMFDGNSAVNLFGPEFLDPTSKYYNHSSVFLNGLLKEANTVIGKRIFPEEAKMYASLRVYLDVLKTEIEVYERDPEGNFKRGADGKPIPTGEKVEGYNYRYVVKPIKYEKIKVGDIELNEWDFGAAPSVAGDLTSPLGNTSTMYPLFDFAVPHFGVYGNLAGVSLYARIGTDIGGANTALMNELKAFPFDIELKTKTAPDASGQTSNTLNGAKTLEFVCKPGAKSRSGLQYNLKETFVESYNELRPAIPGTPPTWGPFDKIHVYQKNIDAITSMFFDSEIAFNTIGDLSNQTKETKEDGKYLINFISAKNQDGTPYQTVRQADLESVGTIMAPSMTHWAKGGTDGDMDDKRFAQEVDGILEEFGKKDGKYADDTVFFDSVMYDSGYPIDTKLRFGNYIGSNTSRYVVMTTHVAGEGVISAAEENARAQLITGQLRLYPESVVFGTNTMRAHVVKGNAEFAKGTVTYSPRVPCSYEVLLKFARYEGAMNGKVKPMQDPTEGENNFFTELTNVSNGWTPYRVRNAAWQAGCMWAEKDERQRFFFPAIRTVFSDDTSTLTNWRVMHAHVELDKICAQMRRVFSGKDWEDGVFKDEIEKWFYAQLQDGKFGGKLEVEGECIFTPIDKQKGYAWHFIRRVAGGGMKTVQTTYSENYRLNELPEGWAGLRV